MPSCRCGAVGCFEALFILLKLKKGQGCDLFPTKNAARAGWDLSYRKALARSSMKLEEHRRFVYEVPTRLLLSLFCLFLVVTVRVLLQLSSETASFTALASSLVSIVRREASPEEDFNFLSSLHLESATRSTGGSGSRCCGSEQRWRGLQVSQLGYPFNTPLLEAACSIRHHGVAGCRPVSRSSSVC